ncbi:hypothetical protein NLU13_9846 [Sarocladium strictum]|uniref:Uncharacterized protein n=1 Tax=Sarocladium strictum TaxID=5046 RepID=A0AA39G8Q4_SARSR|nr:hypothetical protein NLU13_9846 [Sarocladium strictum]
MTSQPRVNHPLTEIESLCRPNGQAIPYPGLINLHCDHASLPQNLALAIGYAREDRPTRRQIFPVLDPGVCLSSTPGQLKPDWLVRDLGLHWTPDADAPDLKVNIYLTPVPDGIYVGSPRAHINLEQQRAARNAPCVVISRALLLKMLHAGYELPDSVLE